MKTIAIILCLVATAAWAGEEFTVDSLKMADLTTTQITSMIFTTGYNEEAGTLSWEGGVFKFSGNPDTSAQVLLDWMNQHYNTRAELYCQPKNAEIISILERAREFIEDNEEGFMAIKKVEPVALDYPNTAQNRADKGVLSALEYTEKLRRETKLRKDIEGMIRRLK